MRGKDPHYGSDKSLYKLQEQVLDMAGPLTCLWSDLLNKEATVSNEDVLLLLQRALVLVGSASHAISLERRKIAWARINPKLKSLASDGYEKRETNLVVRASWKKHPKGLRLTKRLPRSLVHVKVHLQPRGKDSQRTKMISAIFWTGALLRSTAARRRNATSRTPHSQNRSPTGTSTSPEIPHSSQPPRAVLPRTTSAPPTATRHIIHSPYTCWYNPAPNSEYPYTTTGRMPGPLLEQLVYSHKQPVDPTVYPGIPIGIYSSALPVQTTATTANVPGGPAVGKRGNGQVAHQAGGGQSSTDRRGVCESNLFGSKKGPYAEASYQLKAPQPLHSEAALQNGGSTCSEGPSAERRLDGFGRSEGCIPVNTHVERAQKTPSVPMGRAALPVSVSPIRAVQRPANVHKDPETSVGTIEAEWSTFCGVHRRHPPDDAVQREADLCDSRIQNLF